MEIRRKCATVCLCPHCPLSTAGGPLGALDRGWAVPWQPHRVCCNLPRRRSPPATGCDFKLLPDTFDQFSEWGGTRACGMRTMVEQRVGMPGSAELQSCRAAEQGSRVQAWIPGLPPRQRACSSLRRRLPPRCATPPTLQTTHLPFRTPPDLRPLMRWTMQFCSCRCPRARQLPSSHHHHCCRRCCRCCCCRTRRLVMPPRSCGTLPPLPLPPHRKTARWSSCAKCTSGLVTRTKSVLPRLATPPASPLCRRGALGAGANRGGWGDEKRGGAYEDRAARTRQGQGRTFGHCCTGTENTALAEKVICQLAACGRLNVVLH